MLHHVSYVTHKITLNVPDNVSNMIYLLITQLHNFCIYFINVLNFCHCICYLVFYMLFPSIGIAIIDYTCITFDSEYSKFIRLLFKRIEVLYYGALHNFTAEVTDVTL